jgi:hypothetical protein
MSRMIQGGPVAVGGPRRPSTGKGSYYPSADFRRFVIGCLPDGRGELKEASRPLPPPYDA